MRRGRVAGGSSELVVRAPAFEETFDVHRNCHRRRRNRRGAARGRASCGSRSPAATILRRSTSARRSRHAGVCLTVVEATRRGNRTAITTDVGAETLAVTTLGGWRVGDKVNLERSLQDRRRTRRPYGQRPCRRRRRDRSNAATSTAWRISAFRAPAALAKFIAVKGSVALDGRSLTVNAVDGDRFEVLLIPHTLEVTTLGRAEGRRSRQYRGRPDGPLRGATDGSGPGALSRTARLSRENQVARSRVRLNWGRETTDEPSCRRGEKIRAQSR